MNTNLDFINLISAPEADTVHQAFGITDDRAREMAKFIAEGMREYQKACEAGVKMSKADLYLCIARTGFIPDTEAELAFVVYTTAENVSNIQMLSRMKQILPAEVVAPLMMMMGFNAKGGCDCAECKRMRGDSEEEED